MDPLAGQRQRINEGDQRPLTWPDRGEGAPVEVGQIIKLRSCHIEITRVTRTGGKGRPWMWVAYFTRYVPQRERYLLARSGGHTDDPEQALRAQDDHLSATVVPIPEDQRSEEHLALGEPPEPEGVPLEEIANYSGSMAARQRYLREMGEERHRRRQLPIAQRLQLVQAEAQRTGVDLTRHLSRAEAAIEAAERKVARLASAPSDRAA